MDSRTLNNFLIVANEQNITKAAKLLHITQPTISRQLATLEKELNVKLFKRSNHRIYLTKEGQLFQQRARELLDFEAQIKDELNPQGKELSGEIRIGCGEFQGFCELAQLMKAFHDQHPLVKFYLQSGNNEEIRTWLNRGTISVGLLLEPVNLAGFDYLHLETKETWGILARQDSKWAKKESIKPGELVGTSVITTRDRMVHQELESWSGSYSKQMRNLGTYNLLTNAESMVEAGMGPAICFKPRNIPANLTFVPFDPPITMNSVLAWKKEGQFPEQVIRFVDLVAHRNS